MPTVTFLEKLYGSGSPETFEKLYSSLLSGLNVQLRFAEITNRGWIQIEVSGEDETAALSLLDREIGLAPASLDNLRKFSVMQGKVVFSSKSEKELYVDLGVFSPKTCDAVLSEKRLCVKIIQDVKETNKNIEAILSEAQFSLFSRWVRSRFDRLIILGSHFSDVERAVKFSRHSRDIIKIESLGILEQVVLCKLGTDAVGLIPKLGRYLKSAVLFPFSPKKILEAIGSKSFDL